MTRRIYVRANGIGQGYFGFDCVCFVKSITFWDWNGNADSVNGGAKYDGSTDYTEDGLAVECTPNWDNGVQITEVTNVGLLTTAKYGRTWKNMASFRL